MPRIQNGAVIQTLQTLFGAGAMGGMTDEQLLERFASRNDPGAEAAFTVLVARHGPMVLGVCRQMLRDEHEAEDAFQATFLILASKARSIRRRNLLAHWLYKVAYRVALQAKSGSVRRRTAERESVEAMAKPTSDALPADLLAVLHEEVNRLPEKYRAPIVLCYLKGQTNDAAAQQLGWPVGTVSGRLARARERLRFRLTRRGLALPAGLLAAALSSPEVSAAVPPSLMIATVKAAFGAAGAASAAGAVSASVTALKDGVLRSILLTKLSVAGLSLLAAGAVVGGVTGLAQQIPGSRPLQPTARSAMASPHNPAEARPSLPGRADETPLAPPDSQPTKTSEATNDEPRERGEKQRDHDGERAKRREGEKERDHDEERAKRREGEKERERERAEIPDATTSRFSKS